jgi:predicted Zn-dependent protease
LAYKNFFFMLLLLQLLAANVANADENEPAKETTIVPESISDAYSDIDMRLRLAAKPSAAPCVAAACELNREFDARVQQMGEKLAASAYVLYPTLKKHVEQFSFAVVDKEAAGAASNGNGKVVLFRGLQSYQLTDDALGFVMAREMGHVIGNHHHKNSSTKLIISAIATVLFPAAGIIGISSTATQATTATTLLTSAATTATSMLGSEVAMAKMKPNQLIESDEIAINLMNYQAWDMQSAADMLQFDADEIKSEKIGVEKNSAENSWLQDLQVSDARLQTILAADVQCNVLLADAEFSAENDLASEPGLTTETDLTVDSKPATKNGFEDFDPSKGLGETEQTLPPDKNIPETASEPTSKEADVKIEAIQ